MTTYDLPFEREPAAEKRPGFFPRLKQAWTNLQRRRREAATVIELSRLDARLLRDVGIEPMDVYDALHGRRRSMLFNPERRSRME
jgi:uncharacterized protein YjiS (DUF1127 family)